MIEVRNLSHGFQRKSLFNNVAIRFLPNERYGIVGANGSGKSTFLKILAKEIEPDGGDVDIDNRCSFLRIAQDHNLSDHLPIIDAAMMGSLIAYNAIKEKDRLLSSAPDALALAAEISRLEEIIHNHEGYRLRSRAQTILEGLGLPTSTHEQSLNTLSGGYKWRVFLAQALVKSPNILMLDEPTNHLDILSIRWLEVFLANYAGLIILVSHDKRFMDNVCSQILDIDFDTITTYSGNYTAFEEARRLFLLQKEKEIIAQEKEIKRKQEFIDRFRYKASKARQAQSRVKQLERMEMIEPVRSSRHHPKLKFEIDEPGSKEVLSVKNLSKSYGEKTVVSNLSFDVLRGEKIAIVGANGTGKSTIIKALAEEFPECKKAIKWGFGCSWGYFAQDSGTVIRAVDTSVLEWLWQFCADRPQSYVQGMLGRVLFSGEDVKKSTKNLSGGELSRLYLAYLMHKKPNVLLLDEPTNHLDLESIETLTSALSEFAGTVIIVSHDRNFIDQIAARIIEVKMQGINDFLGTYSEFVRTVGDYLDAPKKASALSDDNKSVRKDSFEEQKRRKSQVQKLKKDLEKVMLCVEEIEARIKEIEDAFLAPDFFNTADFSRVAELDKEKSLLNDKLADKIQEWEQIENTISELTIDEKTC